MEFEEQSIYEGLISVKEGGGTGLGRGKRHTAIWDKLRDRTSGEDVVCWTCPGAILGQHGCAFICLLAYSQDEGCPGEGVASAR